ncbi:MAG: DUF1501 domain-containing protein [Polyangiaceae bacterium]|nr:DUF1501 domain-containing protein [Polyangiaceae bacterium]
MSSSKFDRSRRNLLALGSAGIGAALLGRWLGSARDAEAAEPKIAPAKSCIVLWMQGGPSHVDTFDPKAKSLGPGKDRATRAAGVRISEHLPLLADRMDKVALIRGMTSKEGNHQRAQELAHTGHVPNPTVAAPSLGAWVLHDRGPNKLDIPSFVSLGGLSHGGGFFGSAHDPFVVQQPGSLPQDLAPARAVVSGRQTSRRSLLSSFDRTFAERVGDARAKARIDLYGRADAMMKSPAVGAFDVSNETEAVRAAYGDTDFGRGCLVARRLVEVGVPFIEVTLDGWDTHEDNFDRTKKLMGTFDPAMSTLIAELDGRGLLDSTLVVWMGEFGRTPRINGREGRDHYPAAFSVAVAGAGVRGGTVLGETDEEGAKVVKGAVTVPDLLATLGKRMGVDQNDVEFTPQGRPINPTQDGAKQIEGLFS